MSTPNYEPWTTPISQPVLDPNTVHIWRVLLDQTEGVGAHFAVLSTLEQRRAQRFYFRAHAVRYTIAHGMVRHILARYLHTQPDAMQFMSGEHGKPAIVSAAKALLPLHFNLSHSADIALVAVSNSGAVGVDVEWWRPRIQHLEVAERFFSVREREALSKLVGDRALTEAFFAAWSRKEAYLKATGHGITRGLHHFDVSLEPNQPAHLLEDRLDPSATQRWVMANIEVAPNHSAALVATRPLTAIQLFQSPPEHHF